MDKDLVEKSAPVLQSLNDAVLLNNDVWMPRLGTGTSIGMAGPDGNGSPELTERAYRMVMTALETGYRSIDTAIGYGTERACGQAVRDSGIPREQVFVTSKFASPKGNGVPEAEEIIKGSLERMKLDYIDLYLIHWPVLYPGDEGYLFLWEKMEKLYQEGLIRAIGISNGNIAHLERLREVSDTVPAVDQVELHPFLQQHELRQYCEAHNIRVQAWSVQAMGRIFYEEKIAALAQKYKRTVSQIVLRWALQEDLLVNPRSERKERIIENSSLYDFALAEEDMQIMRALNTDTRFGPDPATGPIGTEPITYLEKKEA